MNSRRQLIITLALTGLLSAAALKAQELTIPVGTQADRSEIRLPAAGMDQDSVRKRWGAPREVRGPVGNPPISQWHYADFVVYFEYDRVLHTVPEKAP